MSSLCQAETSQLVVIDIQDRLIPHIHQHEHILERVRILLQGLQILEVPVLLTEQYPRGLGPTNEVIRQILVKFNPIEKIAFS